MRVPVGMCVCVRVRLGVSVGGGGGGAVTVAVRGRASPAELEALQNQIAATDGIKRGPEFDRIGRSVLELPDADEVEEDDLVDDDIINVAPR